MALDLPPNDKLYYPLYVKCIERDIPFCTQVGHTGPLMPSEPGRPVPYIDEVALTFPELRIVWNKSEAWRCRRMLKTSFSSPMPAPSSAFKLLPFGGHTSASSSSSRKTNTYD